MSVPALRAADLVELTLRLADDRLVLGHRVSEWIGYAPVLEEELALGNLALDLIDQATLLLDRAARLEGRGRRADDLAYFRGPTEFRNLLLVEQPNGDFARTIVRQFFFDVFDLHLSAGLAASSDAELATIAARCEKEAAYHVRHSREWMLRLGDGTEESHARMEQAVEALWPFTAELFESDPLAERVAAAGVGVRLEALREPWREQVHATLRDATLTVPAADSWTRFGGRRGSHGEALDRMLTEMQCLARAHPGATW